MKFNKMVLILIIVAWPLYYLYQHQLGAISFLVLAIFFLVKAIKELKMIKKEANSEDLPVKSGKNQAKQ